MGTTANGRRAYAELLRPADCFLHPLRRGGNPQAMLRVNQANGMMVRHHPRLRRGNDRPGPDARQVDAMEIADAVRVNAARVREKKYVRGHLTARRAHAVLHQHGRDEILQVRSVYQCSLHRSSSLPADCEQCAPNSRTTAAI